MKIHNSSPVVESRLTYSNKLDTAYKGRHFSISENRNSDPVTLERCRPLIAWAVYHCFNFDSCEDAGKEKHLKTRVLNIKNEAVHPSDKNELVIHAVRMFYEHDALMPDVMPMDADFFDFNSQEARVGQIIRLYRSISNVKLREMFYKKHMNNPALLKNPDFKSYDNINFTQWWCVAKKEKAKIEALLAH